jgi:hypothetical protein
VKQAPAPPLTESPSAGTLLRVEAEARLAGTPGALESTAQLVHELQVHQIELELQNAELQRTQVALQTAHDAYFDAKLLFGSAGSREGSKTLYGAVGMD